MDLSRREFEPNRIREAECLLQIPTAMSFPQPITSATLDGKKVALRPVTSGDAPTAYRLIKNREEILRWLVWRGPTNVRELEESFAQWMRPVKDWDVRSGPVRGEAYADYLFAIVERGANAAEHGPIVGTISARFANHPAMGDIGYWLGEHVWGRGYATEAIRLMTYFCFEHLGISSLCAWVFVGNEASRRALEKNGFTLVRTAVKKVEQDGRALDEWYYVLLRSEWERDAAGWSPEHEALQIDGRLSAEAPAGDD